MKAACPNCGTHGSVDLFLADPVARECIGIAAALPNQMGPLALRYCALFRTGKRALPWARVRSLLSEIREAVDAGAVRRNGRDWPANADAWAAAMNRVLEQQEKLVLPLKGHGYLLAILAGQADKAEAAAERESETRLSGADAGERNRLAQAKAEVHQQTAANKRLGLGALSPERITAIYAEYGLEAPQ